MDIQINLFSFSFFFFQLDILQYFSLTVYFFRPLHGKLIISKEIIFTFFLFSFFFFLYPFASLLVSIVVKVCIELNWHMHFLHMLPIPRIDISRKIS